MPCSVTSTAAEVAALLGRVIRIVGLSRLEVISRQEIAEAGRAVTCAELGAVVLDPVRNLYGGGFNSHRSLLRSGLLGSFKHSRETRAVQGA